ncbi:MAG: ABC transporter permease [Planctomycetia bacterium]
MDASAPPPSGGFLLRRGEWALLVAILVAVVLTAIIDANHSYWFQPLSSFRDIARSTAMLGIFALGAAVVIIAGGIDLSAGSMIALSTTVCAATMLALSPQQMMGFKPVGGMVVAAGCLASLLTGFLVGTLHAWLITAVRLPPFIATLATLVGLRSLARALAASTTAAILPTRNSQINVYDPIFKFIRDNVWVPVAVFGLLAFVTWLLLSRTVLGRHVHALGGNEQAARLAGIRTDTVKWFAYCYAAMTAALAGLFYVANESVAAPATQARGHELNAIAAAVVGGCSLSGGLGTVPGTVLGTVFLRVVIDGVSKVIKTDAETYEGLIVGVVVVLAVTFSQAGQVAKGGRRLLPGGVGLCVIPALSIMCGSVVAMTASPRTGIAVGIATLIGLAALRFREGRQATASRPA